MTDIPLVDEELGAASAGRAGPLKRLSEALAAEAERRILWLPVFFGAGIALYFALSIEPPLWLGVMAALAIAILAMMLRRWPVWRSASWCLAFAAAGFALITATSRERAAPMLDHRLGAVAVAGRVVDIDTVDRGWRAVIATDPLPSLDATQQPRRVRIHISAASDLLSPGDRVSLKAMLYPVPGQAIPGGHDLQREAFFAEISAVGYSLGGAHRLQTAEDG